MNRPHSLLALNLSLEAGEALHDMTVAATEDPAAAEAVAEESLGTELGETALGLIVNPLPLPLPEPIPETQPPRKIPSPNNLPPAANDPEWLPKKKWLIVGRVVRGLNWVCALLCAQSTADDNDFRWRTLGEGWGLEDIAKKEDVGQS